MLIPASVVIRRSFDSVMRPPVVASEQIDIRLKMESGEVWWYWQMVLNSAR
jgi:hypothetical protein